MVGHPFIYESNTKSSSLRVESPCGRPVPIEWLHRVGQADVSSRLPLTAGATPPEEAFVP